MPEAFRKTQFHLRVSALCWSQKPLKERRPKRSSEIILISGGNTGLGLEIVRALCRSSRSYKILLAGRSLEKAAAATEKLASKQPNGSTTVEPIQLDVDDDESINSACKFVEEQFGRLDVLVNNAGANFDRELYLGKVSLREAWNKSWAVNTVGSHVVSSVFTPLLLKSADPRLIFIASGTATLHGQTKEERFTDRAPAKGWSKEELGWSAYRSAKTGMNMMMREWARVLKGRQGQSVRSKPRSAGYWARRRSRITEADGSHRSTDWSRARHISY
ncbi:hypothetical protein H0G86_010348 [Trichoderma simmonsii]|uniref:Uncharacterized protein n=1 Tax=Trichoderma simmonsii TaxID=1491479 RepID=A0A8G0LJD0_9HYPO|nr:hypothetical protein H0G86_010348 [Trichoderma simmonsii]